MFKAEMFFLTQMLDYSKVFKEIADNFYIKRKVHKWQELLNQQTEKDEL